MQDDTRFIEEHEPMLQHLATRLARSFEGAPLEREELVAWGRLGLLEARKRFDADRGVRFSTFAYYRIRGAMIDGVRKGGYVSRRAHAKLKAHEAADALTEPEASQDASSLTAKARAAKLEDTLGKLSAAYIISAVGQDQEQDAAPDPEASLATRELRTLLKPALAALPERERKLIEGVYFHDRTLEGLGKELGLSKSWASRLHAKTLAQLRDQLAV